MTRIARTGSKLRWLRAVGGMLLAGPALPAAQFDSAGWAHRQEFELPGAGIVKLALPLETLDHARAGLPDLRLIGPAGEEVPYAIEVAQPAEPMQRAPRSFRVQLQKLATQLIIETGATQPLESVELHTTAGPFVKSAKVEISVDGEQWELADDGVPLSRQRGANAVALPLHHATAAFIRITTDDWRTLPIAFSGATLTLAAAAPEPMVPLDAPVLNREEFAGATVLTIDLQARHVPLAAIDFTVADAWFTRVVTVKHRKLERGESTAHVVAGGTISRARLPHALREQLRLPLRETLPTREVQVHIANGNNPPLAIEHVRVQRRPVWLVFRAGEKGRHVLLTGHARAIAPAYDLDQFAADFHSLPETPVSVGPATPNPVFRATDELAEVPLLGPALDIAPWTFRKTVTPAAAGAQELELDLDVLAHAQPGLADLRLLRDGRQAPYLLERTALHRNVRLQPQPADDAQRPRVSRWELPLPVAAAPIARLTLSSPTPLFRRTVQLFEEVPDRRGEISRRTLSGVHEWASSPDRREPQLTVDLTARPATGQVFVEIDNGDNPPIALADVQAEYPVVRLLFRADAHPLQLHYGFDNAAPPRYDLALVAPRLLESEKFTATLGPEEAAEPGGARAIFAGMRSGVLLWSALGLVVIVLLVVIARLLPKPPARES